MTYLKIKRNEDKKKKNEQLDYTAKRSFISMLSKKHFLYRLMYNISFTYNRLLEQYKKNGLNSMVCHCCVNADSRFYSFIYERFDNHLSPVFLASSSFLATLKFLN